MSETSVRSCVVQARVGDFAIVRSSHHPGLPFQACATYSSLRGRYFTLMQPVFVCFIRCVATHTMSIAYIPFICAVVRREFMPHIHCFMCCCILIWRCTQHVSDADFFWSVPSSQLHAVSCTCSPRVYLLSIWSRLRPLLYAAVRTGQPD